MFDEKLSLTKREGSFFIYDNKVLYLLVENNRHTLPEFMLRGLNKYKTEDNKFKYSIESVPLEVYLKILNEMEYLNFRTMHLGINWDEFKNKSQNDELKDFFRFRGRSLVLKSKLLQESHIDIETRKNLLMTYYFKLLDLGKQ